MFFPLNKRPTLNRLSFLLLFSIYIAVFLNLAFYRQVIAAMPLDSVRNWLVFLSMPLVAISVINIVATIASFIWLDRLIIALFILVSAAAQYFIWNYGVIIDRSMLVNILDTTPSESFALLTPQLVATLLLSGVVMAGVAFWVRVRPTSPFWKSAVYRIVSVAASVICILLVASLFYKDYASLFRNQKELVKSLSPSNAITATLSWYKHNRDLNLPLVKIGEDARLQPAMQTGKKNLTILIVGETSRAANFSLSGYERETNPLLKNDNITYFPHTASCGTATAVSVPCMFSGMPRVHYDDALAGHQEGLLDVIQRAGIKVLWNDNDGGCKGACDRVPHQDLSSLNLAGMCIKGECYDEVLFHGLEDYIQQLQGNGVIVLHTIGSHGPTYYNRYPPQFRRFMPTCDTNQIQDCSQQQLVNTYDNTLLYVDFIVDKAIKLLQAHQDRFTTSLVYLSDHGESLGENGTYLHGMPYAIAPEVQKHVPMLIWLSPDYQQRYGVNKRCLDKLAAQDNFSQDNLFSTMLGLTGTATKVYKAEDDILTSCRKS
ncbi:phosphoethanolamine transferase EptA [Candidatus Pantoea alvi]|uniref:phosphoethanolamine transferase EptA n=1 Tax=Enterobacter agglomerans TaxID=549 RepID=UPI000CDDA318|nr:phosphoethanolamine transferase EptA [Pantoea agglomerans]POW55863.1 phosphoethanolamine transferase EptA [Pantoea alvi]UBN52608.1 phosphoethanolamine transferase EptA [Pantoea agglomerans]